MKLYLLPEVDFLQAFVAAYFVRRAFKIFLPLNQNYYPLGEIEKKIFLRFGRN
ncbi:MAG: hypothetical protein Q8Q17_02075 [bacterium]|nr:hypothetical protein [bacterium]